MKAATAWIGVVRFPLAHAIDGDEPLLAVVPGHGRHVGHGEEPAVLGERDQFDVLRQHRFGAVHPGHVQVGVVVDGAFGVGIEEFG